VDKSLNAKYHQAAHIIFDIFSITSSDAISAGCAFGLREGIYVL